MQPTDKLRYQPLERKSSNTSFLKVSENLKSSSINIVIANQFYIRQNIDLRLIGFQDMALRSDFRKGLKKNKNTILCK